MVGDNVFGKRKNVFISIFVILIGLIIAGATYAYLSLAADITNGIIIGETPCFIVNYDISNGDGTSNITGSLFPSMTYRGGLSGVVSIGIDQSCDITGVGNIYMNVVSVGSALTKTVSAHCENSTDLSTLTEYTTSSSCTDANGIWVTSGTALKYAFYNSTIADPVKVGYITGAGEITLNSNFTLSDPPIQYYVYIWLDGEISDNSYSSSSFNGYIHSDVTQVK